MFRVLSVVLVLVATLSCQPGQTAAISDIATQLDDRDQDGWFTASNNMAVSLSLVSGTFPAIGGYSVVVDEVRFPMQEDLHGTFGVPLGRPGTNMPLGPVAVTTLVRGVHGFPASGMPFSASVKVVYFSPLTAGIGEILGTVPIAFGETSGPLPPLMVKDVTLNFSVSLTPFADPNPDDANGDADGDGISEKREADLASLFGGIGDPRAGSPPDLLVVLGGMKPDYQLSQWSREDMLGRFALRGFRLHFADGLLNGKAINNPKFGIGGSMNPVAGVPTTGSLTVEQARLVRDANVLPSLRAISYFALLADGVSVAATSPFGNSSGIPGSELVMRVGFVGINDIAWYQGGVLMHELGHLLGLCHPTLSTGAGGCAAIPVVERDPGATVMGAPSEDPNVVLQTVDVLRRPLDYSPTQWTQLRLGVGFAP